MVREPVKRRATYEDVLKAPEHVVAEIIDGELVTSPRPALQHAHASSVLGADLGGPFGRGRGGPGGWWILFEPELHFGEDILVPDLAGWRRERMPEPLQGPFTTIAPDWICEVLSPGTHRVDRIQKLQIYAREQVRHAWLVDPDERTLEVFRLYEGRWVLASAHSGEERVRVEPFEAVEIELAALWVPADSKP